MRIWFKRNYPIIVLVLIVLSVPYWMAQGVRLDRINRYSLKVDLCENIQIPDNIPTLSQDSYCRCVKNANKENRTVTYCETVIQKRYQKNE